MKQLFLIAVASAAIAPAAAQAQAKATWNPDIASVPVAKCTAQEVTSRMRMQAITGAGDLATGQLPLLDEIRKINDKAEDPDKPVGEQLWQPDLVRFVELEQALKVGALGSYVESRRERDAKALQRMVEIADAEWRFQRHDHSGDDAALAVVLHAMREIAHRQRDWPHQIDVQLVGVCSFAYAASQLAEAGLAVLRETDLDGPTTALQIMANKYKVKAIDPAKLTPADRDEYYRIRHEMDVRMRAYAYVTDMANLVWLAQAMDANYAAMKQDVIAGGGEVNQIGKTAERMLADGQISPQQQMGWRAISVINERIPADMMRDLPGGDER
jgi:hypothetical protein